jgi:hypothetical protein
MGPLPFGLWLLWSFTVHPATRIEFPAIASSILGWIYQQVLRGIAPALVIWPSYGPTSDWRLEIQLCCMRVSYKNQPDRSYKGAAQALS